VSAFTMSERGGMSQGAMRRVLFVLVLEVSALLVLASSASALCVFAPFDRVVRASPAVWWGTVTGIQRIHTSQLLGWGVTVHVVDVLKGQAEAGENRVVMLNGCIPVTSRSAAEDYVGRTQLFIGSVSQNILIMNGLILTPQNLSPMEQYQRALNDLGLHRPLVGVQTSSKAWVWALGAAAFVVLVVVGRFVWSRRRPSSTG
jgi:hypothetical protein